MRSVKCRKCGAIIQANGEKCFCPKCYAEVKATSTLATRVCRECGKTFTGGPHAWYCPDCRAERRRLQSRESQRRTARGKTRKLGSTDFCIKCGKEYVVKSGLQKYCPDCAEAAVREIDRAKSIEWVRAHIERISAQKDDRRKNRKVCRVCGKGFYSGTTTVTCSPECANVLKSYYMASADYKRGKRKSKPDLVEMALKKGIDVI